jgi:putative membrane protein
MMWSVRRLWRGGWLAMSLMMVVIWGSLIFGGIAVWRAVSRTDRGPRLADTPTPEQLLDERFARGEIDVDEYTHRRELLRSRR